MKKHLVLACAFALTSLFPLLSSAATGRPNILFILADDLGWADLGCFGSTFYDTPNLDGLAKEDIGEQKYLVKQEPERATQLKKQMDQLIKKTEAILPTVKE